MKPNYVLKTTNLTLSHAPPFDLIDSKTYYCCYKCTRGICREMGKYLILHVLCYMWIECLNDILNGTSSSLVISLDYSERMGLTGKQIYYIHVLYSLELGMRDNQIYEEFCVKSGKRSLYYLHVIQLVSSNSFWNTHITILCFWSFLELIKVTAFKHFFVFHKSLLFIL